jgi:hypothetical protein
MEGLKLRSFVVAGLMLLTAAWAAVSSRPQVVASRDEDWMKKTAPARVGDFDFLTSNSMEPGATYKSPQMVYDALHPTVGILARVYEHGGEAYDVNLIASRDRASFHDPRVCFTAQGYSIQSDEAITIKTKTRGDIPATLAAMKGPQGPTLAVFFYRGPNGFYGTTMNLKWALLWEQLRGNNNLDGVFYRFIPTGVPDRDRLIKFVQDYMDLAGKQSDGYF